MRPVTCETLNVDLIHHTVSNVDNPVLIDQCYDTAADVCAQFPSKLTISDVHCVFLYLEPTESTGLME